MSLVRPSLASLSAVLVSVGAALSAALEVFGVFDVFGVLPTSPALVTLADLASCPGPELSSSPPLPRAAGRFGSALTSSVAEGKRRSDKGMGCFASTISAFKGFAASQRTGYNQP